MTNRCNPQHGANMVDRYIGTSFDIVYAVYKELPALPVVYEFATQHVPNVNQIMEDQQSILSRLDIIEGALLDITSRLEELEGS